MESASQLISQTANCFGAMPSSDMGSASQLFSDKGRTLTRVAQMVNMPKYLDNSRDTPNIQMLLVMRTMNGGVKSRLENFTLRQARANGFNQRFLKALPAK
jgi:hypothetical protein